MMNTRPILFDEALAIAKSTILEHRLVGSITIIRDIKGKIRLLLERNNNISKQQCKQLCVELSKKLGVYGYAPDSIVIYKEDLIINIDYSVEQFPIYQDSQLVIYLLDRQISAHDWLRPPFKPTSPVPRATFFGIKGGVGRSTALILWSWILAKEGKRVILFDLDLESPGISRLLLPPDFLPDYGIIDWFVENANNQGDCILGSIGAQSPLGKNLRGEIFVIPAFGTKTGAYVPKLARCYSPIVQDSKTWGERLQELVNTLEQQYKPDITLLDSRSGIHDIAAVTITRMGAIAFLFAVDSIQTWQAYNFLFSYMKQHPNIKEIRQNFQIVASMIPETGREAYLERFVTNSWDTFRDNFYDESIASENDDSVFNAFSFDRDDEDAPHWPLSIYWHRALQEFNPFDETGNRAIDEKTIEDAMGRFHEGAMNMLFNGNLR